MRRARMVFTSGAQRQSARDGEERDRRRVADADVSAAVAAGGGRRLHRRLRLRPHARDLSGQVQQSRKFPRLPVRAAAADSPTSARPPSGAFMVDVKEGAARARRRERARVAGDAVSSHGGHAGRRRRLRDDPGAGVLRSRCWSRRSIPGPIRGIGCCIATTSAISAFCWLRAREVEDDRKRAT